MTITDGPGAMSSEEVSGGLAVCFSQVNFQYTSRSELALADMSFEIPAGHTVALVGPSGAGKDHHRAFIVALL